jgi:predicted transcriptional regulator of viral defense system
MEFFEIQKEQLKQAENLIKSDIIFTNDDFLEKDISKDFMNELIKDGVLEEVYSGVYIRTDSYVDDFLVRQMILPKGIYSNETALYLHDLTDKFPYTVWMNFPVGFKLPKNVPGYLQNTVVRQVSERYLNLEIIDVPVSASKHSIRVYSKEKTLCDIVKKKNVVEQEIVNKAFKCYLSSKERDIGKLMQVAKKMRAEKQVRTIVEVLL